MTKINLWDDMLRNQKRYETAQHQRIAIDSVRGHISEHINALRKEASKLPTSERRAQLLEEINNLYDLFCELGS